MTKDNEKKRVEAMLELRSEFARSCATFVELNENEMDSSELMSAMMSALTSFIAEIAVKSKIKAKTVVTATEHAIKLHQIAEEAFSDDDT